MRESSCRQQGTDNSHIVPNVKRASKQLRNDGRERDKEQPRNLSGFPSPIHSRRRVHGRK